ncbi:hypothetical protein NST07_17960 [Paenibacillus sp. FSL L8-0340]|uniref:hypothetical protein n=1 Tax=Paenibacillus sp. FSL L8-0340 TaxID=2954685 RepID=UPI003158E83A
MKISKVISLLILSLAISSCSNSSSIKKNVDTVTNSSDNVASSGQNELYQYIRDQKWEEAKQFILNVNNLDIKDLDLLSSYVEIRIESANLSSSTETPKLYEPILARINKLNIEGYTGEFKDQMNAFYLAFQKERIDYYELTSKKAELDREEQDKIKAKKEIAEAIKLIKNKKYELASNSIKPGYNDETSAIYNYANALAEKKNGTDKTSLFHFYLMNIPSAYSKRLSKEITELKLNYQSLEKWDQDLVAHNKILADAKKENEEKVKKEIEEANSVSPFIGMTRNELKESSWGLPTDINKTTTVNRVSEQWVYRDNKYVYLDDGVVTAIQE